jgi:prophage regulatory protein
MFPLADSSGNLQPAYRASVPLCAHAFYLKLKMDPSTNSPPTIERAEEVARLLQQALSLLGPIPLREEVSLQAPRPKDRLLRLPEVERLTGLRKSAIYDQMQKGAFPTSVKCGTRAAMWSELAIQSWIAARLAHQPSQVTRFG